MSRWKPIRFHVGSPWAGFTLRFSLPVPAWSWLQIRFSTLLLLILLACVVFAWRRDRVQLEEEIITLKVQIAPKQKQQVSWGVEQILGAPDTKSFGDRRTAWASETPDGQQEWIVAHFENEVTPKELQIYETYNPGAVTKVSLFTSLGNEVVVWQGSDPTAIGAGGGVSKIPLKTIWPTKKVKVYIDSANVPGWNEIDAIGLVDLDDQTQWTRFAEASSSYGATYSNHIVIRGMQLDVF